MDNGYIVRFIRKDDKPVEEFSITLLRTRLPIYFFSEMMIQTSTHE